eukprot:m.16408 g.16408  ORF g.16408 m.16408 type:complete len:409 (-) comp3381_c0_seq1:50-1276(-)
MQGVWWMTCALALSCISEAHARPTSPSPSPPSGPTSFNCTEAASLGAFEPITLSNGNLHATFIRYGATLTHLLAPDKHGDKQDIVLGFDDASFYCSGGPTAQHPYFGASIGRVANRIANGSFTLDGKTYHLPKNDHGINTLHGGWVGFDRHVWTVAHQNASSVLFTTSSPSGEEGFPGTVVVSVRHTLTSDNTWVLEYNGTTDATTVLAMTNHAYFNLNANVDGATTVERHVLTMPTAHRVVAVNNILIPTGALLDVTEAPNTYLDFTSGKAIGTDINKGTATPQGGYDNAWVFSGWTPGVVQESVVRIHSPITGISVSMSTNQPSVQVYSGNFLNGTDPTSRIARKQSQCHSANDGNTSCYYAWRGAVTMEAQAYPDAVHHASFPSIVLEPGKMYHQYTTYTFSSSP